MPAANPAAGGAAGMPQRLQQVIQQNPQLLAGVVAQLAQQNPQVWFLSILYCHLRSIGKQIEYHNSQNIKNNNNMYK